MSNKEAKIKKNTIIKNFQKIYRISRMVGLNSYQMSTKRGDLISIKCTDIAYCIFIIVLFAIIGTFNTIINIRLDLSRSLIINIGFNATLITGIFDTTLLLVSDLLNRNKIWKILCDCYDFDQEVRREGEILFYFILFNQSQIHLKDFRSKCRFIVIQ